jgi:hypothetical protein
MYYSTSFNMLPRSSLLYKISLACSSSIFKSSWISIEASSGVSTDITYSVTLTLAMSESSTARLRSSDAKLSMVN